MLMTPVTNLPATGLILLAILVATRLYQSLPAPWLIAFLCCLALQLFLVGARYGYGVDAVLNFQHLTGVLIPPLGYLAFTNPSLSARVMLHGLSILSIVLVLLFATHLVDWLLALITLGYAAALILALRRYGDSVFSWASLGYVQTLRVGLFATIVALVLSGVTDALIAADFLTTGGIRISSIVAIASIGGVALLAVIFVLLLRYGGKKPSNSISDNDEALIQRLKTEIAEKELFRDPDLTLNRLARRLALPAREISQAVNRGTGLNVSQFVNNMRISAVCEALTRTDVSITMTCPQ